MAAGIVAYLYSTSSPPAIDINNTQPLEQALTTVPAADVAGADINAVPRPTGAVRSYYLSNPTVTTVVYTRRTTVDAMRREVEAGLGRNGWGAVSAGTATGPPTSQRVWQQVYSDGTRVLQVEVFTHGDVTATIYVLQRGRSGQ